MIYITTWRKRPLVPLNVGEHGRDARAMGQNENQQLTGF